MDMEDAKVKFETELSENFIHFVLKELNTVVNFMVKTYNIEPTKENIHEIILTFLPGYKDITKEAIDFIIKNKDQLSFNIKQKQNLH